MKLVKIKYVDTETDLTKGGEYTYAASGTVEVGNRHFVTARGKQLLAEVVSETPNEDILAELASMPFPISALQVITSDVYVPVVEEDVEEVQD